MRRFLILALATLPAACGDPTDAPPETPLPAEVVAPLRLAASDARTRLLPALAGYQVGTLAGLDGALGEMEGALASRLPSRIAAASRALRQALDDDALADPATAPDRDAIGLVLLAVEHGTAVGGP